MEESLDQNNWTHQIGDGCPDLCGWGNNELQFYQSQNATVGDGTLKITARQESVGGKSYTSSRIRSLNKGEFTFGRFEARIKLPTGQGLWPAFWMLSSQEPYGGWPQSGEIDIMELVGNEPETVHGTIHYGPPWPNNRSIGTSYDLIEGIFNDEFHTFSIEWNQNQIKWFVDDYLYATIGRGAVIPDRWPFDHDFHFLLNVAVGGNWPGNPNSATEFPQVMEVDYVRVYNETNFPYLSGDRIVSNKAEGEIYELSNLPDDATIEWTVPEGASIVSGQGSGEIVIDWGELGGTILANVSSSCISKEYQMEVVVEPAFQKSESLENFDEEAQVELTFSDGTMSEIANPMPNDLNPSDLVGNYVRNESAIFDVLVYNGNAIQNAAEFIDGEKKFYIDILTDAPAGTTILLQLENQLRSMNDFPIGRNSRFEAFTSKQNEWERLEFSFVDQPDGATSNFTIDQLVFLFAPNTQSSNTYTIDNFDIYAPQTVVSNNDVIINKINVLPNPTSGVVFIENLSQVPIDALRINTSDGKSISDKEVRIIPQGSLELNLSQYPAGIYILKLFSNGTVISSQQIILNQ